MANPITPTIKNPQSTGDIQTLKPQEKLQPSTSTPGFGEAFTSLAMQPTVLGELGAKMAQASSDALMTKEGAERGKTPGGELIPAITHADKVYEASYLAQAKNTLSLQAEQSMFQAQEEMSQANKLTPDMIQSYHENMMQTMKDIASQAPTDLRNQLESNFAEAVLSSTHNYNTKMIGQQKQQAIDHMGVVDKKTDTSILDNALSGNAQQAQKLYQEKITANQLQRGSGMMSESQQFASNQTAKMALYSGMYSNAAETFKQNKKLPEFIRSLPDSLPDELSPTEKLTVANNVLSHMNALHNFESQDNQLITSELNRAMAEGTLTSSMLAQAQDKLPEVEYNNFLAKMWHQRTTQQQAQAEIANVANNLDNIYVMADANEKQKNGAFKVLTEKKMSEDPTQDKLQAQTAIVKGAGGEIPAFTNQLDAMVKSGSPEEMYRASLAIASISKTHPQNIASLSKETRAMTSIFEDLREATQDTLGAWNASREQVLNKNQAQQEQNDLQYAEYKKDYLATPLLQQSKAKKMLDVSWGSEVTDLPATTNKIIKAWEANYKLTNGNVAAADKLTKDGLSRSYGETVVNGKKQVTFMPLEKLLQIDHDSVGLIHNDIVRNVSPQLVATKEAYDKGNTDYYYRIASKENDYLALAQEKLMLDNKFSSPDYKKTKLSERNSQLERYRDIAKELTKINSSEGVQVERVHRGAGKDGGIVDKFSLQVSAGRTMQLTNDTGNPISGSYDLGLVDKNGWPTPFAQVTNTQTHYLGYRPNVRRIRQEYASTKNAGIDTETNFLNRANEFIDKTTNPTKSIFQKLRERSEMATESTMSEVNQ